MALQDAAKRQESGTDARWDALCGHRPFRLGKALIDPTTRAILGPGGRTSIEPRVMQVLLELVKARGAVVTREQLVSHCWAGTIVGDDAINRTIGEIRKLARGVGDDSFGVETISKAGYKLVGLVAIDSPPPPPAPTPAAAEVEDSIPSVSRRMLGGAAVTAAAALLAWRVWPDGDAQQARELVADAEQALRQDLPEPAQQAVAMLRRADALRPNDPMILGKLAVALGTTADYAEPAEKAAAVTATEDAARRALALDPRQADARAALAVLQPEFGDWLAAERRLRAVLAVDPVNEIALAALGVLLQGVGRVRDNAAITLPISTRFPLAPKYRYRRSYILWTLGRLGEADRNIDNALVTWPRHPSIWFARLWILALTGRAPAALAMLNDKPGYPLLLDDDHAAHLRISLTALATRTPADVRAALDSNMAAVMLNPTWAIYATMVLSVLGELDAAFQVAEGYLVRRGPRIGQLRASSADPPVRDQRHRKTMMLFVAATKPMRNDPRFMTLCEEMGMAAYWRAAGVRPDFLIERP